MTSIRERIERRCNEGAGIPDDFGRTFLVEWCAGNLIPADEADARITEAVVAERERCARIVEGREVQGHCVEWPEWGPGNRSADDRTVSLTRALAAAIKGDDHDG